VLCREAEEALVKGAHKEAEEALVALAARDPDALVAAAAVAALRARYAASRTHMAPAHFRLALAALRRVALRPSDGGAAPLEPLPPAAAEELRALCSEALAAAAGAARPRTGGGASAPSRASTGDSNGSSESNGSSGESAEGEEDGLSPGEGARAARRRAARGDGATARRRALFAAVAQMLAAPADDGSGSNDDRAAARIVALQ